MFRKKQQTTRLTPAAAADELKKAINDALDEASANHVGIPAQISVLTKVAENLRYCQATTAASGFEYAVPREMRALPKVVSQPKSLLEVLLGK